MLVFSILLAFFTPPASATLGGVVSSVDVDRQTLHATTHAVEPKPAFTAHRLSAATNDVVEYARPDGTVFAVTWRGPKRPDLSKLLGAYYSEYRDGEKALPHGRRAAVIRGANVVVSRGGQMRDLHGKAYVPALVPANVDVGGL